MPAPATKDDFLEVVRKSQQIDNDRLDTFLRSCQDNPLPTEPKKLAALLVREGLLTSFQAEQFLLGRHKGFTLGGYRIIDRIGAGGGGAVYLAEHQVMKRRVALKVLPSIQASDLAVLERFRREAQAAAALDHPNIVRAYDFRQEGQTYFLVMEYVNGPSLEDVLHQQGALPIPVACDYIRQAAIGLQHAHENGLVHRDVKPANLLVDASGIVKVLDLGLARFAPQGQQSVTQQFDENVVMGTADYLAPEQAVSLHDVDARADVYSLGATFYALLAGEPPFSEGTVTQKLIWHQMRTPRPIRERRAEVPSDVAGIVAAMMAKSADERIQSCAEVAALLEPWSSTTPTSQGPAQPGRAPPTGKTPAYIRASSAAVTAGRARIEPGDDAEAFTTAPEREPVREHHRGESPAKIVIVKDDSTSRLLGVMMLGAVMSGILLLVAGVIAFLIWGPQPNAPTTSTTPTDDQPPARQETVVAKRVGPIGLLSDRVGEVVRLNDKPLGSQRVAFAADGRRVAAAGYDNIIRVWDVLMGVEVAQLKGHREMVTSLAFAHKGNTILLSASRDTTVRLWNLNTKKETKQFPGSGRAVWCAVFSPDDRQVLIGGDDAIGRLYEAGTNRLIREFRIPAVPGGPPGTIQSLAFHPQGARQALSGSQDKIIRVWNLDNGQTLRQLTGHTDRVTSVVYTPDGKRAVSGSGDGTVRVWDVDAGKLLKTFDEKASAVWSVSVASNGRQAVSAHLDGKIRLWDLEKLVRRFIFEGHAKAVTGVAFSPDGKHFASCSEDATLRVWAVPPK